MILNFRKGIGIYNIQHQSYASNRKEFISKNPNKTNYKLIN